MTRTPTIYSLVGWSYAVTREYLSMWLINPGDFTVEERTDSYV